MDEKKNFWLAGFFDGEGSCSFSQSSPSVNIVNSDPKTIAYCLEIFKSNNIEAKISERAFPSKTKKSNRVRWDLFINQAEEAGKASKLLSEYSQGKKEQNLLIQKYMKKRKNTKRYHKIMRFLNQTNNILIYDHAILEQKIEMRINCDKIVSPEKENLLIKTTDFNEPEYLAGIFDAEGTIYINQKKNKHRNTDSYTPFMSVVNTNKKIITAICSVLKNNNVGYHVQARQGRNRVRWDISITGLKRTLTLLNLIGNKLISKRDESDLLYLYVIERLKDPYCINDIGFAYKKAIESLR